ncbi:MAG: phosphoadenylyl-sulfate reductase [Proteobacteria bacterium]|nr:phosphoadenylyl-sulfate reductase [Pseudomonadota bacterium]
MKINNQYFDNENIIGWQRYLKNRTAVQRIEYVMEHVQGPFALTSSFGAQSAVSLHMLTQIDKNIPVILIDTGYLFPETYRFIDQMCERLKLNLKVYKSHLSPAWLESRHGQLWSQGLNGITKFNNIMKVTPLDNALDELGINAWFSGIRNTQSLSRQNKKVVEIKNNRLKVHAIIDWTDKDIYDYLSKYKLPYHPLWEKGYISIGDIHTSRPITANMAAEETRFFGLKRECGIHD